MKRIALVVQRCHPSIVGGSEALAWQYATLLSAEFEVDILTTAALDYITWANELPIGPEHRENIRVHRFEVTITRSSYWHRLHARLLHDFEEARLSNGLPQLPWTIALQEEFIRHQGPFSKPLLDYLRDRHSDYQTILFLTYLYPTTYFGVAQVPPEKVLIAPTLHDEPPAYLSVYRDMIQQARSRIWLTEAERQFGEKLWGELPGEVVAMAIDTQPRSAIEVDYPYILYCGRIDPSKGCADLIEFFLRFKQNNPSNLRLVLTGQKQMTIPRHKDIEFRGFVSIEEKFQLMAGASVFVMPSPYESFSIVTLEAMAQGTPVLVNGASQVLVEHVTRSGAGKIYADDRSFAASLKSLLTNPDQRAEMKKLAQRYIFDCYTYEQMQNRLIQIAQSSG